MKLAWKDFFTQSDDLIYASSIQILDANLIVLATFTLGARSLMNKSKPLPSLSNANEGDHRLLLSQPEPIAILIYDSGGFCKFC